MDEVKINTLLKKERRWYNFNIIFVFLFFFDNPNKYIYGLQKTLK